MAINQLNKCLARGNHPQGKEQGWHHPEGDSKQVVGL